jgi:hypothetical protein
VSSGVYNKSTTQAEIVVNGPKCAHAENAVKLRETAPHALAAPRSAFLRNVRVGGSNPLFSTISVCVQNQGFPRFWSTRQPPRQGLKSAIYNTLQHSTGKTPAREKGAHNETKANGVGVRQPRPLVLLG